MRNGSCNRSAPIPTSESCCWSRPPPGSSRGQATKASPCVRRARPGVRNPPHQTASCGVRSLACGHDRARDRPGEASATRADPRCLLGRAGARRSVSPLSTSHRIPLRWPVVPGGAPRHKRYPPNVELQPRWHHRANRTGNKAETRGEVSSRRPIFSDSARRNVLIFQLMRHSLLNGIPFASVSPRVFAMENPSRRRNTL